MPKTTSPKFPSGRPRAEFSSGVVFTPHTIPHQAPPARRAAARDAARRRRGARWERGTWSACGPVGAAREAMLVARRCASTGRRLCIGSAASCRRGLSEAAAVSVADLLPGAQVTVLGSLTKQEEGWAFHLQNPDAPVELAMLQATSPKPGSKEGAIIHGATVFHPELQLVETCIPLLARALKHLDELPPLQRPTSVVGLAALPGLCEWVGALDVAELQVSARRPLHCSRCNTLAETKG